MKESPEHTVTSIPEKHGNGAGERVRHRGRCSCGASTYMHYSTPDLAKTALRRTHIRDTNEKETT
ncbi:MAG: hypothetical protein WBS24_03445 [Terriglobales bacterium]